MTSTDQSLITSDMRAQYEQEGYFVLESVLSEAQLELLRSGAQYSIDKLDAEMDAAGTDVIGINHRGKRYFSSMIYQDRPELREFLFGDLMADVCRATIGPEAYLVWEQYVIKGADKESAFAWHQDSGFQHEDHDPYVTCWIALDDVTEENGPVSLLPYSRSGIRSYVKHFRDPVLNDMVCYFGSDPGISMPLPAGSIVVFSSVVIHRSGPNLTDRNRRVYLAQYAKEPIMDKDGTKVHGSSDPFLKQGENIAAVAG